jgi:putative peptide zinc metalloprotease protein
VSFQVVLVVGDSEVIVPQNIAAAVNYDCVQCLTYALASQLVVTIDGPLTETSMTALSELWAEIAAFARDIASVPLAELQSALEEYQEQIKDIIREDPAAQEALLRDGEESQATEDPSPGSPSETPAPGEDDPSTAPSPTADPSSQPGSSPTTEASPTAPSDSPAPTQPESSTAPAPSEPAAEPSTSPAPATGSVESSAPSQ